MVGRDEAKVSGHAAIFSVRCTKFVDLVSGSSSNTLNLSFLSSEAFIKFVHYVYTGQLEVDCASLWDLLAVSALFGVDNLTRWLLTQLSNTFTPHTAPAHLADAAGLPDCLAGQRAGLVRGLVQWAGQRWQQLQEAGLPDQLDRAGLLLLLRSPHLSVSPAQTWRLGLGWARRRAGLPPGRPPRAWTDSERAGVRAAMEPLLPHLRLAQLDPAVWGEEVEPTGAVPPELALERVRLAAAEPPGRPAPVAPATSLSRLNLRAEGGGGCGATVRRQLQHCSRVLATLPAPAGQDCAARLAAWTGRPGQAWSVIFRGSEHGFRAASFHQQCAGAAPSLVLVRTTAGRDYSELYQDVQISLYIAGYLCGGYTDIPWSTPAGKGRYVASDQSFLFSLAGPAPSSVHPRRLPVTKKMFAVSHHPGCGPVFGAGADLFICDQVGFRALNIRP